MTRRRRGLSSCFQSLSILAGTHGCPHTRCSRQAGRPPRPPSMAQEAASVLLVVLAKLVSSTWHEGECWGVRAQQGSLGTAACRVPLPSGGLRWGGREGCRQCWGEPRCLGGLGCLQRCAAAYGEEQRGCWDASREEQKTSLSITPLPARAQLFR